VIVLNYKAKAHMLILHCIYICLINFIFVASSHTLAMKQHTVKHSDQQVNMKGIGWSIRKNSKITKNTPIKEIKKPVGEQNVSQIIANAETLIKRKNYNRAVILLKDITNGLGSSEYVYAQSLLAYAYYRLKMFSMAVVILDRLISRGPYASNNDYAYYLRAHCYKRLIGLSNCDNHGFPKKILADLSFILKHFPYSAYRESAESEIIIVNEFIVNRDIQMAKFYFHRGIYISAIYYANYGLSKSNLNFAQRKYFIDLKTSVYKKLGLYFDARMICEESKSL
jgi:outer membrane assembly lipoprotein YfiO